MGYGHTKVNIQARVDNCWINGLWYHYWKPFFMTYSSTPTYVFYKHIKNSNLNLKLRKTKDNLQKRKQNTANIYFSSFNLVLEHGHSSASTETGRYDHSWRTLMPSQSPRLPPMTENMVTQLRPINMLSWTFTLKITFFQSSLLKEDIYNRYLSACCQNW